MDKLLLSHYLRLWDQKTDSICLSCECEVLSCKPLSSMR